MYDSSVKRIHYFVTIIICLFLASRASAAENDINSVIIPGDAADYGLWINSVQEYDFGFKVLTTGAEFIYDNNTGILDINERIDNSRHVAKVHFGNGPSKAKMIFNTPDHTIFEANDFFLGIYGDSTFILSPRSKLNLRYEGFLKPDYKGNVKGEFVLADDKGGITVLPQRHETGYVLTTREFGEKNWFLSYELQPGQRVMSGVFPPKKYDYIKAYSDRCVFSIGVIDNNVSMGILTDDQTIKNWSKYCNILVLMNGGLYHGRIDNVGYNFPGEPYKFTHVGPYEPVIPEELKRVVRTGHSVGMKVLVYITPYFHNKTPDANAFLRDAADVFEKYNIDGFYIDTLYGDIRDAKKWKNDKIANYAIIRQLRKMVGPKGILFLHGSGDRSEVACVPNIDAICDFTLYGESVKFENLDTAYMNYQVRKINMSNSIGYLKPNMLEYMPAKTLIDGISKKDIFLRWISNPYENSRGKWAWNSVPPEDISYYFTIMDSKLKNYMLKNGSLETK